MDIQGGITKLTSEQSEPAINREIKEGAVPQQQSQREFSTATSFPFSSFFNFFFLFTVEPLDWRSNLILEAI